MSRPAGLVLAALAGTASVCVLVWFSLSGQESRDSKTSPAPLSSPPPDITQGAHASDVTIDIADKKDPSRRAGYIRAKSTQQMENRQVKMVSPEVWHFPRAGRLAHIVANEAEAYIPGEQPGARPERAVLRGNAELRLFDPKPNDAIGTTSIDPAKDHAWLVAKAPILYYDGPLGEITVPDDLDMSGDAFSFRAKNATMRFSDAEQRLEFLRIEEAKSPLIIKSGASADRGKPSTQPSSQPTSLTASVLPPKPHPKEAAPLATAQPPSTPASTPQPSAAAPAAAQSAPPTEAFYHLVIESPVTVAQAGREISSDRLEAWVRLVGNKLPDGAIGTAKDKPATSTPAAPAAPTHDNAAAPSEPATPPAIDHAKSDTPSTSTLSLPAEQAGNDQDAIQITWTGALEVRPLALPPAELLGTDIALRFTANDDHLVTFRDEKSGASGSAPEVFYAATPREVTLLTHQADQVVRLALPNSGEAVVQRISIGINSGKVLVTGVGALQGVAPSAAPKDDAAMHADADRAARNLTWVEGAEFLFATEHGQITSRLLESHLTGAVGAGDRNGRINADRLDATFAPDPAKPAQGLLSLVKLTGNAGLADLSGSAIFAETIEVAFDIRPEGGASDPSLLTAMNGVSGQRNGSSMSADFLQATLVQANGRTEVDQVVAKNNVSYVGTSAVTAGGDELQARPRLEIVDITGTNAYVGQRATQINGTHIHIEGATRRIEVAGAGSFEHQDLDFENTPQSQAKRGRVTATWSHGMTFDDLAGHATCDGTVRLVWEQGPVQRDTLDGERVEIWVTPQKKPSGAAAAVDPTAPINILQPQQAESGPIGDRVLLHAVAYGLGTQKEKGGPVKVDSRRFVQRADGQPSDEIERLLYLEGLEVQVDNVAHTLTVPIAGKLFVLDQRERQAASKTPTGKDPLSALSDSSGEAFFRWNGTLVANRADGTLIMTKDVALRHRRLDTDALTELTAAYEVKAKLSAPPASTSPPAPATNTLDANLGQLEWATAKGSAWLANQGRQMQADELLYNATLGEVDATSNEGNNVSLLEPKSGTPVTARRILWNLKTGRIEVKQPGTIVAPR